MKTIQFRSALREAMCEEMRKMSACSCPVKKWRNTTGLTK